jgi:hypothetical protein
VGSCKAPSALSDGAWRLFHPLPGRTDGAIWKRSDATSALQGTSACSCHYLIVNPHRALPFRFISLKQKSRSPNNL